MKEYENWKKSRLTEMADLMFAKPTDVFLFTRFTVNFPKKIDSRQILYAEDIFEVAEYIRYIFLYDILNDIADDLKYDFKTAFDGSQADIISIMNYWFKFGNLIKEKDQNKIFQLVREFNYEFSDRNNVEYEICILKNADELCEFLKYKHKRDEKFDRIKLENICSNKFFVGKLLKEFVSNLFNT